MSGLDKEGEQMESRKWKVGKHNPKTRLNIQESFVQVCLLERQDQIMKESRLKAESGKQKVESWKVESWKAQT